MYVKKWLFLFPATNNRCTNNTTSSVAVHPQKFKGNINFVFLLNRSGGPIHPLHVSDATLFSLLHSLLLCWICESKLEQVYQRVPFVINKWVTHRPTTANKSIKQKPLDFLVFQFLFFYFYKVSRFPNPSGFLSLAESTSLLLCFILSAVSNNFLRFLACLVALPKAEGVMSVVFRPAPSSEAESH